MVPQIAVPCWQQTVSGPSYEPNEFNPYVEILLLDNVHKIAKSNR